MADLRALSFVTAASARNRPGGPSDSPVRPPWGPFVRVEGEYFEPAISTVIVELDARTTETAPSRIYAAALDSPGCTRNLGSSPEFVGEDVGFREGRVGTSCRRIYRIGANPEGGKRKTHRRDGPLRPSVLAPGSALGSLPSVALSSAQAVSDCSSCEAKGRGRQVHGCAIIR